MGVGCVRLASAKSSPGQWVAEPGAWFDVNLWFGNQGMEAFMTYVRLQSSQHRRRPVRASAASMLA
ncbi:MAG: hypothetical protein B7Z12_16300 [Caulobacter vibrioides]|uniref:Uncharacterized protein n=1 Tax=Caulobacter vibrioides TaxID=155892 RepID=A0A258CXH1_CAUVI|nr:MAG: hypothetical protein B7Z12_16300 [Caulobacter vibrioides]